MRNPCAFVILALLAAGAAFPAAPAAPAPGKAIDYAPLAFYPARWKELGLSTKLYPWEGRHTVLLTVKRDLDPRVMGIFLDRLDGAWGYYAEMIGRAPGPGRSIRGKTTIAAVPDVRLTCGYGCGWVGAAGIEVTGFDATDYPLVARNPKAFPHYYFYEMGRNYFVFGDRHSAFTTGFAVFMRYRCMDVLGCEDEGRAEREQIEQAEAHYAQTEMPFLVAFTTQGGLGEKEPRLKDVAGPSDQPVIYASAMLRLHREREGDVWLKQFYRQLATCPEAKPDTPERALVQALMWMVAASVAAGEDLAPLFVDRWRFPMGAETRKAWRKVKWSRKGLTAAAALQALPPDPTR